MQHPIASGGQCPPDILFQRPTSVFRPPSENPESAPVCSSKNPQLSPLTMTIKWLKFVNIFQQGIFCLEKVEFIYRYSTVEWHSSNPVLFMIQVWKFPHKQYSLWNQFWYSATPYMTFGDLYNHFWVEIQHFC